MVNSPNSWHDSDDIDSDLEQQAYNLLYYDECPTFVRKASNLEEKNVPLTLNNLSNSENNEVKSDNEDIVINLVNSSDSTIYSIVTSDSDSDTSQSVEILKCSNVNNALCVGSSSDESDYEAIHNVLNSDTSSLMLNIVSDKKQINVLINEQESFNSVDNLFFDVKSTDLNWAVDYIPASKNKFSSRYYDNNSKSVCGICTKKGHTDEQCVRTGPVCISCGKEGHNNKKCDTIICFSCFNIDHRTKSCQSTKTFLSLRCKRCGQRGHSEQICPDIWRQYKYTLAPGPPIFKKFSSQNKSSVFCANCAKSGHFTEQCPRNRMNSHFVGPPPIMEIIKYDDFDIYQRAGIRYSTKAKPTVNDILSGSEVEFPSFMENMNVTTIVKESERNEPDLSDVEMKNSQFGDGVIMLSPIVKEMPNDNQPKTRQPKPILVNSSTPLQISSTPQSQNGTVPKVPTKLPGITTELLKKLFPSETANLDKLPPYLRKKLRKKLKNFIDHGYLPGDSSMTQERMEFWLQEISTGRSLNYREKKKLLGSVSAALHSISDRVSSVEMMDCSLNGSAVATVANDSLSIPDRRKRKNNNSRIEKNVKNSLKISKKEKKLTRKLAESEGDNIKSRLRKSSISNERDELMPEKTKLRRRKSKSINRKIIYL